MILGYVNTVVQTVVSFVYTPLLLGGIGQSEYGLYQIIGSLTAYINVLESMLTTSILRFYCQARADGDEIGMENTLAVARFVYGIASVLVVVLAFAFSAVFVGVYSRTMTAGEVQEGVIMLFVVCANIVVNMMFFTYSTVVLAHERFTFAKTLELIGLVLQPIVILALIFSIPQALVISVVQLAISFVSCLVRKYYAVHELNCKIVAHDISRKSVMPIVGFSGIMLISMIADIIFAKTGQLVIGYVLGTAAVAIYSVGYQIYQAYAVLGRMVSSVFVPRVTEISKLPDSTKLLSDLWNRTGRFSTFVVPGILLGFALYGSEFIYVWVGDGYEEAVFVALLMMLAFVPDIVQALGLTILQVLNRYNFRAFVYVACAVVNVVLSLPLITIFGVPGAAVASFAVLLIGGGLVMNWYYGKVIGLNVLSFWRAVVSALKGVPIAFVVGLAVRYVQLPSGAASLLVHCLLFAVVYTLSTYFVSMNGDEKKLVRSMILKRN